MNINTLSKKYDDKYGPFFAQAVALLECYRSNSYDVMTIRFVNFKDGKPDFFSHSAYDGQAIFGGLRIYAQGGGSDDRVYAFEIGYENTAINNQESSIEKAELRIKFLKAIARKLQKFQDGNPHIDNSTLSTYIGSLLGILGISEVFDRNGQKIYNVKKYLTGQFYSEYSNL